MPAEGKSSFLVGLFLICMCALMLQIIETRILSVVAYYYLAFFAIGMAIFGGTLPATRIAVSAIDPLALTAMRTAIAGICSLVLVVVLRRTFPPRHLWLQLAIASRSLVKMRVPDGLSCISRGSDSSCVAYHRRGRS